MSVFACAVAVKIDAPHQTPLLNTKLPLCEGFAYANGTWVPKQIKKRAFVCCNWDLEIDGGDEYCVYKNYGEGLYYSGENAHNTPKKGLYVKGGARL